jgi:hypothetical protein
MKYGIQISESDDGAIAVTQLVKRAGDKEFTSLGASVFVDKDSVHTNENLLEAIAEGLRGDIKMTKRKKG